VVPLMRHYQYDGAQCDPPSMKQATAAALRKSAAVDIVDGGRPPSCAAIYRRWHCRIAARLSEIAVEEIMNKPENAAHG